MFDAIRSKISAIIKPSSKKEFSQPKQTSRNAVQYFLELYEQAKEYREKAIQNRLKNYATTSDFWEDCKLIANGNHWEVWKKTNARKTSFHTHEIQKPVIEQQIYIRKTYLTSRFHQLIVTPNVKNIDKIIEQECRATDWNDFISTYVDEAVTLGTSIAKEILDTSVYKDGVVRTVHVPLETFYVTPGATSLRAIDGCWYIVEHYKSNFHQLVSQYGLDVNDIKDIMSDENEGIDIYEFYLDDYTLEENTVTNEEFEEVKKKIINGEEVVVNPIMNHGEYIRRYLEWLQYEILPEYERNPENEAIKAIIDMVQLLIQEHEEYVNDAKFDYSKRRKYPYGRHVVIAKDKIIVDEKNPHEIDWRDIYTVFYDERVPNSFWGRGTVERLWNINRAIDIYLSRIGDLSLLSVPTCWISYNDYEFLKNKGIQIDNDPYSVKVYSERPPVQLSGASIPQGFIELVRQMIVSSQETGMNEVLWGQTPSSHASGEVVNSLLTQSITIVLGESARNFDEAVNHIIEAKIALMRQHYTTPRLWIIYGTQYSTILSEDLANYPKIEVHVKPNTNYPNSDEAELSLALQLSRVTLPDGTPLVPPEFVYRVLQQKYPEFAKDGEFYRISEATKIGLQVLAQQAEQEKLEQRARQIIEAKTLAKGANTMLGSTKRGANETQLE